MADKQATVYVIDLGSSMAEKTDGRSDSDLEFAMRYVWDKIADTVSNGRKTDIIGVIGFRTNDTQNSLSKDDPEHAYDNITVLSPIGQFLMPQIGLLQEGIHPSDTEAGDGISAMVVAIDMIQKYCRKLKYTRNIVFVTNGKGAFDMDEIEEIEKQIKDDSMNITILGVNFDDSDYGYKEEEKSPQKQENEITLRSFCESCNGAFGTMAQAVDEMGEPRTKKTRPIASYKGSLTIGDQEQYPNTFLSIDVERYPRIMVAKAPSATSFVGSSRRGDDENEAGPSTQNNSTASHLQKIQATRTYQVDDESAPGGKIEIEREDMAKGYMYGRTIVPISASDAEIVVFETQASLQILSFMQRSEMEHYLLLSNSNIIVASKVNDKAIIALSSLIHAMIEVEVIAVARLVVKLNKPPILVALAPFVDADYECLFEVQFPFAEDVRLYKFAPLDTVKTVTGKVLEQHRFIPSQELQEAMSDYVDSMDISKMEIDEEDDKEPTDYGKPTDTFSPVLHRINQVIRWRATHPKETQLPEIKPILIKYSNPPTEALEEAKEDIARLAKIANLQKIPPRAKGGKKRFRREQPKPLSGLDIDKLLKSSTTTTLTLSNKIDPRNVIPSFKNLVDNMTHESELGSVIDQMAGVVENLVEHSLGDSAYAQAIECIKVARFEASECELPEVFNNFIQNLKKKIISGELNGNRKDFLTFLRKEKLGLITSDEDTRSGLKAEDANKFYYGKD